MQEVTTIMFDSMEEFSKFKRYSSHQKIAMANIIIIADEGLIVKNRYGQTSMPFRQVSMPTPKTQSISSGNTDRIDYWI